jgi:hypothetical protein
LSYRVEQQEEEEEEEEEVDEHFLFIVFWSTRT